jgi:hypothetical protein
MSAEDDTCCRPARYRYVAVLHSQCGFGIGPSGPCTALEHMNCTGTAPLREVSGTFRNTRVSGFASKTGKSPHSSPSLETHPTSEASFLALIASSTPASVRASLSSWCRQESGREHSRPLLVDLRRRRIPARHNVRGASGNVSFGHNRYSFTNVGAIDVSIIVGQALPLLRFRAHSCQPAESSGTCKRRSAFLLSPT